MLLKTWLPIKQLLKAIMQIYEHTPEVNTILRRRNLRAGTANKHNSMFGLVKVVKSEGLKAKLHESIRTQIMMTTNNGAKREIQLLLNDLIGESDTRLIITTKMRRELCEQYNIRPNTLSHYMADLKAGNLFRVMPGRHGVHCEGFIYWSEDAIEAVSPGAFQRIHSLSTSTTFFYIAAVCEPRRELKPPVVGVMKEGSRVFEGGNYLLPGELEPCSRMCDWTAADRAQAFGLNYQELDLT